MADILDGKALAQTLQQTWLDTSQKSKQKWGDRPV
jgi:hypothetical protein